MIGLIGKKLGMTRQFDAEGRSVPVTVIQAGPCIVTEVRTRARHGYDAVQLGFGERKPKNTPLPMQGHFQKAGTKPLRVVREFRLADAPGFSLGDQVNVSVLAEVGLVDVTGTTKGKGFMGRIRRWNQQRGPAAHGTKNVRESGGVGMHTHPGRVIPGHKMPGHMGAKSRTKRNLAVVSIDPERNLLLVKGSVPGSRNGIVFIRPSR